MSKKLLGDAEVVETPISAKITIHQPTPILRNDGLNPTTGPAIAPAPKAELTPGEVKSLVNQIQETNLIVKQTGRTQSTCPACDNNHYAAWIKAGVPARPLQLALEELQKNPKGAIKNKHYLAIADFTRPSNEKRMYILNLDTGEVDKLYTSHSHRSDGNNAMAARFGNASRSNLTPPGFHVTQMGIHDGIHGASLILQGLEARNSNSADRAIEIHKADYASEAWVKANHYTGRSNGCLAIDPARIKDVIKKLRDGALVYNYIGE